MTGLIYGGLALSNVGSIASSALTANAMRPLISSTGMNITNPGHMMYGMGLEYATGRQLSDISQMDASSIPVSINGLDLMSRVTDSALQLPKNIVGTSLKLQLATTTSNRLVDLISGKKTPQQVGSLIPEGFRGLFTGSGLSGKGHKKRFGRFMYGSFLGTAMTGNPVSGVGMGAMYNFAVGQGGILDLISGGKGRNIANNIRKALSPDMSINRVYSEAFEELSNLKKFDRVISNNIARDAQILTSGRLSQINKNVGEARDFSNNMIFKQLFGNVSSFETKYTNYLLGGGNPFKSLSRMINYDRTYKTIYSDVSKSAIPKQALDDLSDNIRSIDDGINLGGEWGFGNNRGRNYTDKTKKFIDQAMDYTDNAKATSRILSRSYMRAGLSVGIRALQFKFIMDETKKIASKVSSRAISTIRAVSNVTSRLSNMEFGTGKTIETRLSTTERQRSIAAMNTIGITARSYLGQEASIIGEY